MAIVEKNERNSSIELLRILLGFAVIILHFNYKIKWFFNKNKMLMTYFQ